MAGAVALLARFAAGSTDLAARIGKPAGAVVDNGADQKLPVVESLLETIEARAACPIEEFAPDQEGGKRGLVVKLKNDIGVLVGSNDKLLSPDGAHVLIRQGQGPPTLKAALGWRGRVLAGLGSCESVESHGSP